MQVEHGEPRELAQGVHLSAWAERNQRNKSKRAEKVSFHVRKKMCANMFFFIGQVLVSLFTNVSQYLVLNFIV